MLRSGTRAFRRGDGQSATVFPRVTRRLAQPLGFLLVALGDKATEGDGRTIDGKTLGDREEPGSRLLPEVLHVLKLTIGVIDILVDEGKRHSHPFSISETHKVLIAQL